MKKNKVWINGSFTEASSAKISVFDRGFLYGDGVFETMRSYAGVIFRVDLHLMRLFASLEAIRISPSYTREYLKAEIYKALKANDLKSAYIRVAVTRGEGRFGLDFKDTFRPNTVIITKEFGEYPKRMYNRGISAKCVKSTRQNEYSPLAGIKSLNFLNYIIARFNAKSNGASEAILTDTKGHIAEGASSNIFLVKKGALLTPDLSCGILPGITRGVIVEIAKRLKIAVKEKKVAHKELLLADEVFLTNSLIEILPVTRIDSRKIGNGSPGEMTKLLRISYQKQIIKEVLFDD